MTGVKQLLTRALRRELSRLDGLYQRHAGEECYIFGNGISLKWMDLDAFGDRPVIAATHFIYHKQIHALDVRYCTMTEPFWFWPIFVSGLLGGMAFPKGFPRHRFLRHRAHKEYRRSILQNPQTLFFLNFSNYPVARFANALYVSRWYQPPFEAKNPFRERIDAHRGSLAFQLSLAIFLGFKKAYLVGNDYTHFPSRSHHFFETGKGILDGTRGFSRDFIDYAKQHIDLVTVTLDGTSETMDYITYKDLTRREPRFRENTEIVDRVKLESLASYPNYQNIFATTSQQT